MLLETGLSCEKVALELGLSRGTVQTTKTGWLREKFDSLRDKARTGAPKKIKPQEEKMLLALANEKPLCATELLQVHLENGGERIHSETIRRMLKVNEMSWKITRHSLKIPAIRGQRLNVLAALMSSGYLEDCMFYGRMTGARLVNFIKEAAQKYDKPITFILDNVSFHTSEVFRQTKEEFDKLGVTLKFLPPYSPELNRIEKLWHTIKHRWMDVKHRTTKILEVDLSCILEKFGSVYKFEFYDQ